MLSSLTNALVRLKIVSHTTKWTSKTPGYSKQQEEAGPFKHELQYSSRKSSVSLQITKEHMLMMQYYLL